MNGPARFLIWMMSVAVGHTLAACAPIGTAQRPGSDQPIRAVGTGFAQAEVSALNISVDRGGAEAAKSRRVATRAMEVASLARNTAERLNNRIALPDGGGTYAGEVEGSTPKGIGVLTRKDGGRFEGQFASGRPEGLGSMHYPSGARYDGEWKNGGRTGSGVYVANDGNNFAGEWQSGRFSGYGVWMTNNNRRVAIGEFREGRLHGYGAAMNSDGGLTVGRWETGRIVAGAQRAGGGNANANTTTPNAATSTYTGTGTGFVVATDGHVLTNDHVIEKCKTYELRLPNGEFVAATMVKRAPSDDLALLKAALPGSRVASFRSGPAVREGDNAVVFGFPLGAMLAPTGQVATGMISATTGIKEGPRYLQTSAPLLPGNSGGPLLDLGGNVVGVVTAKISTPLLASAATGSGPAPNVGYAIQSSAALDFLRQAGITPQQRTTARTVAVADVVEQAKNFTVMIRCR
jgi:hypothetical protein